MLDFSPIALGLTFDEKRETPEAAETLAKAIEIAHSSLAPHAAELDRTEAPPRPQILLLAKAGILGLMVPTEYGGKGGSPAADCASRAIFAAACGVTNFVALQHIFATTVLTQHAGEEFKKRFLPKLASGEWLTGVCLAHLGRPAPIPIVSADFDGDEIVFNGKAPWMTGWGVFDYVLVGGTLPDGRVVLALADIEASSGLMVEKPYELEVLGGTNTVSPIFVDFRVPKNRLAAILDEPKDLDPGMRIHATAAGSSMGVAGAALLRLYQGGDEREDDVLTRAADEFAHSLQPHWERLLEVACDETVTEDELEFVRAQASLLSIRMTFALVAATGGKADMVGNPANRLYREAFAYTFNAHTSSLRDAIILGLANQKP